MVLKKDKAGILRGASQIGRCGLLLKKHVINVAKNLIACHIVTKIDFAQTIVNPLGEEKVD